MNERIPLAREIQNRTHSDSTQVERTVISSGIRGHIYWKMEDTTTNEVRMGSIPNVIVLDAGILLARLLRSTATPHESEPAFGIWGLALGSGDVSWDLQAPPAATNTQRSLWNEIGRKQIATVDFIDQDGNISAIPTNIIDLTTIFTESEAVGPIAEMALVGGDNDVNANVRNPILPPNGTYDPTVNVVGKDMILNYRTFPVKNKSATDRFSITWRLTL